jgi:ribosome-binding protein aMBF1 (putative translation factor)
MTSNEHPDMSGNPCDEPLVCEMCGRTIYDEQELYASRYNQDVILCCNECACDYDKSQESKFQE